MNKIGIVFAMKEELDALKKYIIIEKEYKIFELTFIEGTLHNQKMYLVESGVGKVNAARATQILIDNFKVDYILNIGVAGGVYTNLKVGDIVVGDKLYQHDFDITAFNHNKGYIPNIGDYVETDRYLLEKTKELNYDSVVYGNIASGDIFCTEASMSAKINSKFNALCVEMEGAAVAQVCYLSLIPFLIVRSISDIPNNDNVVVYEEFVISSSKKVAHFVNELISTL